MPSYFFSGSVTLHGVIFRIEADSLEEAQQYARKGIHGGYETSGAETADWDMDVETGRKSDA